MSLQFSKPASVKKPLSPDIAEELAMLRALHKTPAVLEKQKTPRPTRPGGSYPFRIAERTAVRS
jgi:hypothetical protein